MSDIKSAIELIQSGLRQWAEHKRTSREGWLDMLARWEHRRAVSGEWSYDDLTNYSDAQARLED